MRKSGDRFCENHTEGRLALAEMYVTGVPTRKIAQITQELCGFEVSSSEVSCCPSNWVHLKLTAWRERPLAPTLMSCSMHAMKRCATAGVFRNRAVVGFFITAPDSGPGQIERNIYVGVGGG